MGNAVTDFQFQLRMIITHGRTDLRQKFFADFHHHAVDFNHFHRFHRRMPYNFAYSSPVTTADHQYPLRLRMRKQWNVRNHLVIDVFFKNRGLKNPVQNQHAAKLIRIDHLDGLKLGLAGKQSFLDPAR